MASQNVHFPNPSDGRTLTSFEWRPIRYRNVISILKNPFYAGFYAYGRSEKRTTIIDGRARKSYGYRKPMGTREVFIQDHHEGYINWATTPPTSIPKSELGSPAARVGTFTSRLPMRPGSTRSNGSSPSTPSAIRRGSFESTADLIKKIDRFIRTHNENAQPFVWTASADAILQKLARLCQRISGTEH
jgi:hypothetical protein